MSYEIDRILNVNYYNNAKNIPLKQNRNAFNLVYVDKNNITLDENGHQISLKRGSLYIVRLNRPIELISSKKETPYILCISFYCNSISVDSITNTVFSVSQKEKTLLSDIFYDYNSNKDQQKTDYDLEYKIAVLQLEILLIRLAMKKNEKPKENNIVFFQKDNKNIPQIDDIVSYMQQNLSKKISMDDLSNHFNVSKSYISRQFKKYYFVGAINYFNILKIQRSKELLRDTDKSIATIAEELGYDNVYYFSNQFKKIVTISPKKYRSRIQDIGEIMMSGVC